MKISNAENGPSHGHELMISAPPCSYFVDHPEEDYDACKWGVQPHELEHMMTLSQVLHDQHGLQTSLKPPLAWRMITRHSRFDEFSASDLRMLKDLLAPQTICYG